ncbi:glycosyl hydrolase-related protein [Paraoerskovia marina]|uniref:glycoside hydrolase family 38 N-terminal domain-containing protein n=1 Tax=Paraoerskovia marina TaxID=545619 RepID=UPI0004928FDA|nr:glycosyl hydrolase-related protein [Paraoerskovia marina]
MTPRTHVVTHVHWDREWYRPFEGYRSRLVELAERICDDVGSGTLASFHLDGQTVTLDDVAAVRPDVADRLRSLVEDGRVTIGPWHVLADNQLVSAENLVRNLLLARRACGRTSSIGYSPDAFGHPADLPRILNGFGIDTALVWRGAPPEHARFRWTGPDGAEVFTVNQAYHQAEVLWDAETAAQAVGTFVENERRRLPDGPWLLLNGGDHLAPVPPSRRSDALAAAESATGTAVVESTLSDFFSEARRAAADLPVVDGELRHLGDRLTFLLPGTLSARGYVKALNDRAQVLLERFVEPALVRSSEAAHHDLLAHAWDLLVKNAPHDSICGCSVDEVHRETTVRAERVLEIGDQLVRRVGLHDGADLRGRGKLAHDTVDVLVTSGDGDDADGIVEVDVTTAPERVVTGLLDPDGRPVAVEAVELGPDQWFEADLDLMPDTLRGARHRLAFVAQAVPALGSAVYTVVLGDRATCAPSTSSGRTVTVGGRVLTVADDASLTLTDADGHTVSGLGLLRDGGDRGDSYNYDPPLEDLEVVPRVIDVRVHESAVRTVLEIGAALATPQGLTPDRDARSATVVETPLRVRIEAWAHEQTLRWTVRLDNRADDHRLRWHVPVAGSPTSWSADTHWSVQTRPFTPVLGELPSEPGLEAACGTSPAHTFATAGDGPGRVAVLLDALPEVQGVVEGGSSLAVTLLRSVGWLSRFDLRSRTTGAGPAFEVAEAQSHGPREVRLALRLGDDAAVDLAVHAARHHVPFRAEQVRTAVAWRRTPEGAMPRVAGALVSAFKRAESGDGAVLRVANPLDVDADVRIDLPSWVRTTRDVRLDESALADPVQVEDGRIAVVLRPSEVRSWHLGH